MVGPLPPVFLLGQGTSEPLGGAWLASSALRPLLQGSTDWWPSPRLQAGAWVRARAKGGRIRGEDYRVILGEDREQRRQRDQLDRLRGCSRIASKELMVSDARRGVVGGA